MRRHQVRHFFICANRLPQELSFLQSFLCPHVPDLQVPEPACALPADDPAESTAAPPHSWNYLVTRLGQEVARLQSTPAVPRLQAQNSASVLDSATSADSVERMTSEDLCHSNGRAFPLLVA